MPYSSGSTQRILFRLSSHQELLSALTSRPYLVGLKFECLLKDSKILFQCLPKHQTQNWLTPTCARASQTATRPFPTAGAYSSAQYACPHHNTQGHTAAGP